MGARTRAGQCTAVATLVAAGIVVVAGATPAGALAADPPGNNGTVKVDDSPFDSAPDNEPHVGCSFQVDLYGYDEGDLSATVLFEGVAPTGGGALLTDELDIGGDAAGGGTDLDASGTYDLTSALAGIEPHPQQGWHVKLTIHAEGSQGADVKHKVFWVEGCTPPGTTTTTAPHGSTTTAPGESTTTTPHGPSSTVPPTTTPASSTSPTSGVTPPTSVAESGELPATGTTTGPLVAVGAGLVAVGAGILGALRLRRRAA